MPLFVLTLFLLGLIVGSFLNVVTLRLAHDEDFWAPRSYCPRCRQQLFWYDNIPVVSFLFLRAACRFCRQPISWQYPVVELVTGFCFALLALQFSTAEIISDWPRLLSRLVFVAGLVALFVFDYQWYIVPDEVSVPLIIFALIVNFFFGVSVWSLGLGLLVGGGLYGALWLMSRGRWVGSGDIRLGLLIGAMLGWPMTLVALEISYLIGGSVAVLLLLSGRKTFGSKLPMGTFLTFGAFITLLYGSALVAWWMSLFVF